MNLKDTIGRALGSAGRDLRQGHAGHDSGASGHGGHGGHGLMMLLMCLPMLVIAIVLVATSVAGSGFIFVALGCAAMMALMMGGHGHSGGDDGGSHRSKEPR